MKSKTKKARVIIVKGNQLLMLKRKGKFKFSFPGGNIKKNETKKEGLIREIKEELGVTIQRNDLEYLAGYSLYTSISVETSHYYNLNKIQKLYINGEPYKFEMLCWVDIEDVIPIISKIEKIILKDLLNIRLQK